jgi:hypothetical protein
MASMLDTKAFDSASSRIIQLLVVSLLFRQILGSTTATRLAVFTARIHMVMIVLQGNGL